MSDGPTASTFAGFCTPESEKSHAGRTRHPRSVRKSPEPSVTPVVLSGGGEPRTLCEAVKVLNAVEAAMIGNPPADLGEAGQCAGAEMSPLPKAILLLLSGNPYSGFRTYPWRRTRGRGDDAAGKCDHLRSAWVRSTLTPAPLVDDASATPGMKPTAKSNNADPRAAVRRSATFTMSL